MRGRVWFWLSLIVSLITIACETEDSLDANRGFIRYYGTEGDQEGVDIVVGADQSIYLLGNSTLPAQTSRLYLVKCRPDGAILWQRFFGNSDFARDIEFTSDGRLIVLATSSETGDRQVKLVMFSQDGAPLDSVVYGYAGYDEEASTVTEIADGYIVTGSTTNIIRKANESVPNAPDDVLDAFNFRFSTGLTPITSLWNETLGPGTVDGGVKVLPTNDGFYFFGYSNKRAPGQSVANFNFWVFPLNNFGNGNFVVGEEIFAGGSAAEILTGVSISPVQSGEGFMLSGLVTPQSGGAGIYLAKLRRSLNFSSASPDQVFQYDPGALDKDLGVIAIGGQPAMVKTFASVNEGFFVLTNDYSRGNSDFYLTKITNDGRLAWDNPQGFNFGGVGNDSIGAVAELADGSIVMVGTFNLGDEIGQKKMTLIKVDSEGKF